MGHEHSKWGENRALEKTYRQIGSIMRPFRILGPKKHFTYPGGPSDRDTIASMVALDSLQSSRVVKAFYERLLAYYGANPHGNPQRSTLCELASLLVRGHKESLPYGADREPHVYREPYSRETVQRWETVVPGLKAVVNEFRSADRDWIRVGSSRRKR